MAAMPPVAPCAEPKHAVAPPSKARRTLRGPTVRPADKWGPFTFREKTVFADRGHFVICPFHRGSTLHTQGCNKWFPFGDVGRVKAKVWLLQAGKFDRRWKHMRFKPVDDFSTRAGGLLAYEETLDAMAQGMELPTDAVLPDDVLDTVQRGTDDLDAGGSAASSSVGVGISGKGKGKARKAKVAAKPTAARGVASSAVLEFSSSPRCSSGRSSSTD